MANSELQLAGLPLELLHSIFRQLDPVGLIATSQTCTHFRSIIKPAKKHFAERLLALEIEPDHGGPAFRYFSREGRLEPDWNEDAWDRMRWACTHCLRLLGHAAFDNHSLLRLKNRKPEPGSPAAMTSSSVTSWEPVESRALSAKEERRKRVIVAEEKTQDKALKRQYHLVVTKTLHDAQTPWARHARTTWLRSAELPEAFECSESELDSLTEEKESALLNRAARRIEGIRAGSHRHMRKCNECRFQLGQFEKTPFIKRRRQRPGQPDELSWAVENNKGTSDIPIVRSRKLKFSTPFDRYFPGIDSYMSAGRPSFILPLFRIYRQDPTYIPNTLYMARCPSCTTWQELRAFRWRPRGWNHGEFIGIGRWMTEDEVDAHSKEVETMQCNRCVYEHVGRTVLEERLSGFMRELLETECELVLTVLSGRWRNFHEKQEAVREPGSFFRIKRLLDRLGVAQKKFKKVKHREGWTEIDIYADDVEDNLALMSRCRLEWLKLSQEEKEAASDYVSPSSLFTVWEDDWDEAMKYWRWGKAWLREIEQEPERVVRWALERDQRKLN